MTLRENEKLIEVVRRHKSSLGGIWFLSAGLIFLFLFVLFYLKFNFFGYGWQAFSVLVFVLALACLYRTYVWKNDVLFITDQRVIRNEQAGLFNKTVTEILYQDVHEIIFNKKGLASIVNNYGDLIIRTPSENKIVFDKIPDPEKVVEIINKTRTHHVPPKL
ncbi:MAG: PH domain-containing protein [Candidatus Yanofskybacteria bacterium]|nr:PH domain-containing protein [Candidatus Yanofskybacteria bacterium]